MSSLIALKFNLKVNSALPVAYIGRIQTNVKKKDSARCKLRNGYVGTGKFQLAVNLQYIETVRKLHGSKYDEQTKYFHLTVCVMIP
jgi:hypothetical protein